MSNQQLALFNLVAAEVPRPIRDRSLYEKELDVQEREYLAALNRSSRIRNPKALPISFGLTRDRLPRKTVTRRKWKPSRAETFCRYYRENRDVPAIDKDRRAGGAQIGWLTLTRKPYQESLLEMPDSDIALEGYPELSKNQFLNRFFDGNPHQTVWVVRFTFEPLED